MLQTSKGEHNHVELVCVKGGSSRPLTATCLSEAISGRGKKALNGLISDVHKKKEY